MGMPLIGLTTYHGVNPQGLPTVALLRNYIQAIIEAGGVAVLIPSELTDEARETLFARLDGILFTGGGDIAIELFNGEDHPRVSDIDHERDELEIPLLKKAVEQEKPFLGICRGLQVTNVALGGTLFTHVEDQLEGALKHDYFPDYPRNLLSHPVQVSEDNLLSKVLAEPILRVNSLHHQGVRDLAPTLKAVAFAPDGLVEAVEIPGHRFGFAVQWHPEWLTDQPATRRLFSAFVEACRN